MSETAIKKQRTKERKLVRSFLEIAGYKINSVLSYPDGQQRPDVVATFRQGGKKVKVGVEQTDYFVDLEKNIASSRNKSSPGNRIVNLWTEVNKSISRRVVRSQELQQITGHVLLKKSYCDFISYRTGDSEYRQRARKLAQELIKLIKEKVIATKAPYGHCIKLVNSEIPSGYSTLRSAISSITLWRHEARKARWGCSNADATSIGLTQNELIDIINAKRKQAAKQNWGKVDERWLLITASGASVFQMADLRPENFKWTSQEIVQACKKSIFSKIIFWDDSLSWYTVIWPNLIMQRYN